MSARSEIEVTVEEKVDVETAEAYYALYRETFGELETKAVARQLLHREEFLEEMEDPRVAKYVARDAAGTAIGMSTLTNQLETVPWISPAYFRHHYPEQFARDAVFYIGFTLVQREHRRSRAFQAMIHRIGTVLAEAQAVVGWDICAFNDDDLSFGRHAARVLGRTGDVSVVTIDRQTYYAGTFHRVDDGGAP
ncbi:hypothetical protein [Nocardioides sp. 1609]|uniref:hypothetical protein n=1 Tax=Nocardioides sp. 1609 TaxID=2508327 RepID=UPI00106F88B1|nr:hypothetical protein [Nocardioides sp. 1609]